MPRKERGKRVYTLARYEESAALDDPTIANISTRDLLMGRPRIQGEAADRARDLFLRHCEALRTKLRPKPHKRESGALMAALSRYTIYLFMHESAIERYGRRDLRQAVRAAHEYATRYATEHSSRRTGLLAVPRISSIHRQALVDISKFTKRQRAVAEWLRVDERAMQRAICRALRGPQTSEKRTLA